MTSKFIIIASDSEIEISHERSNLFDVLDAIKRFQKTKKYIYVVSGSVVDPKEFERRVKVIFK